MWLWLGVIFDNGVIFCLKLCCLFVMEIIIIIILCQIIFLLILILKLLLYSKLCWLSKLPPLTLQLQHIYPTTCLLLPLNHLTIIIIIIIPHPSFINLFPLKCINLNCCDRLVIFYHWWVDLFILNFFDNIIIVCVGIKLLLLFVVDWLLLWLGHLLVSFLFLMKFILFYFCFIDCFFCSDWLLYLIINLNFI